MVDSQAFVHVTDVYKTYRMGPSNLRALRGVTLHIAEYEFLAIIGPSGSGKSTLLNLIAGLDKPTSGHVLVGGVPVSEMDENSLAKWRGEHVGLVFQFFQLLPTLTALENVVLPMDFRGTYPGQRHERALGLLERVGMSGRMHHLPCELSGGEQQRIAIARALANDPPLLLADEPTGNLDSASSQQIFQLLAEVHAQGKTVLLVTHEARLAAMAQRRASRWRTARSSRTAPPGSL